MLRIMSRVCVEFHDKTGRTVFSVGPAGRMVLLDAPEAIREDPLFSLLIAEGSLEDVHSATRQKELEADPVGDTDASGKRRTVKSGKSRGTGGKSAPSASGGRASSGNSPADPDDGAAGSDVMKEEEP